MSPFKLSNEKTFHIQSNLLIVLIPIIMWGCYVFGGRVLTLCITAIAVSILTELSFFLILKRSSEFSPIRPITLGLLSALVLPVSAPLWGAAIGGFISSAITLISYNFKTPLTIINPVAASGLILFGIFNQTINRFTSPFDTLSFTQISVKDINQVSTVLQSIKDGTDNITNSAILNLFLGRESGSIGEVSALLLVIACAYLIFKKYISWHIPTFFISSVFLISFFFPVGNCETIYCAAAETLSGGVIFMAVLISTLPTSAPITTNGKIIFGLGCGILTMLFQRFTYISDGSLLAVGIMSSFSGIIEHFTGNKYFSYLTDRRKENEPKKTDLESLLND